MKQSSFALQNLGEIFSQSPEPKKSKKNAKNGKENEKTAKKAANSYLLFCKEKRTALHAQFPDKSSREITKLLAEEWKNLSTDEKNKYQEKYKNIVSEHEFEDIANSNNKIYIQIQASNGQILAIPAIPLNPKNRH